MLYPALAVLCCTYLTERDKFYNEIMFELSDVSRMICGYKLSRIFDLIKARGNNRSYLTFNRCTLSYCRNAGMVYTNVTLVGT